MIRRAVVASILIFFVCRLSTTSVRAHPGNTAADGCHYCRTNCAQWGEVEDERHCHSGGGSALEVDQNTNSDPPTRTPYIPPPTTKPISTKVPATPTSEPLPTDEPENIPEDDSIPTPVVLNDSGGSTGRGLLGLGLLGGLGYLGYKGIKKLKNKSS